MATTAKGTPYVESADLVSGWPAVSASLADHIDDNKADTYPAQNAQTGTTYTFVLADAEKIVTASNGSASTYEVPPQASVSWLAGTVLRVVNLGAGVVTFQGGSGVTVNNTAATLSQYDSATLVRTASNAWTVVKGGGLPKASVSATTGSPNVDSSTRSPKTVYKFTGSGSITVSAGSCEILVIGGGGAGAGDNGGGGGAGGFLYVADAYLPAGTHTVTVGAGGSQTTYQGGQGNSSCVGPYYAVGGGGAGSNAQTYLKTGQPGGSGGGSTGSGTAGGAAMSGQGSAGAGGGASAIYGGGGGGAGGAGVAGDVSGAGGAGTASSITGSAVTYSQGGGSDRVNGNTAANGAANTGNGGGGVDTVTTAGNGGSGVVIIVVG